MKIFKTLHSEQASEDFPPFPSQSEQITLR